MGAEVKGKQVNSVNEESLMARAEERADIVIWLMSLSQAASSGSAVGEALADVLGCEASVFANILDTAARMVFSGEHKGAADFVGSDLSFVFEDGISTAAGMKEVLFKAMSA